MRIGPMITLVAALVLGGLAALLAAGWLDGRAAATRAPDIVTGTIVVAARPLTFGMPLTADELREITWQSRTLPAGAFAKKGDLLKSGRRVVLHAIAQNEPVLETRITGPGQRASLSALIEDGKRAVTVRVDDVRGVAGFILPGERVDVVLVRGGRQSVSDIVLQNVRVLAIDQIASDTRDKPQLVRAVTLEVTTEEAQKLILSTEIGKLSLILRQAGSPDLAQSRRVTAADLGTPVIVPETEETPVVQGPRPAMVRVIRGIQGSVYTVTRETR